MNLKRSTLSLLIIGGSALLATDTAASKELVPAEAATLLYQETLTQTAYCSDGSDRARDGKPRFDGTMEAPVLSYKDYQYATYYEATGELVIARRPLEPAGPWLESVLQGFTMKSQDRHNKIAIGVSEGDGRIHLSFDHHNTPKINYAVSSIGVASDPANATWDDRTFTFTPNLGLKIKPDLVTYPDFVSLHGTGNLIVYWRSGGAIGGEMNIAHYNSENSKWSFIGRFTSREGRYKGKFGTRGPYLAGIKSDPLGQLQVAWLWREEDKLRRGDFHYGNHGLFYAQSQDGGFSWLDSWCKEIADTRKKEVISIDTIGKLAYDIPMELEPSNAQMTSAIDPQTGNYHVIVVHVQRDDPAARSTHHYVRDSSGNWTAKASSLPTGSGATLVFQDDLLFAFIGTDILYANRQSGFSEWKKIKMPKNLPKGDYRWDTGRLPQGVVSLSVQLTPTKRGEPTPVQVLDFEIGK